MIFGGGGRRVRRGILRSRTSVYTRIKISEGRFGGRGRNTCSRALVCSPERLEYVCFMIRCVSERKRYHILNCCSCQAFVTSERAQPRQFWMSVRRGGRPPYIVTFSCFSRYREITNILTSPLLRRQRIRANNLCIQLQFHDTLQRLVTSRTTSTLATLHVDLNFCVLTLYPQSL